MGANNVTYNFFDLVFFGFYCGRAQIARFFMLSCRDQTPEEATQKIEIAVKPIIRPFKAFFIFRHKLYLEPRRASV